MLKMTVSVDNVVLMEQEATEEVITEFMHDSGRIIDIIDKQGWYGFASFNEEKGITLFYKITPSYSKSVLHTS